MIDTWKYMTQLLACQLALMMKIVTTTRMKYMRGGCTVEILLTYLLELKEMEISKLQIVKEQIVTATLTNLSPAITLLNS